VQGNLGQKEKVTARRAQLQKRLPLGVGLVFLGALAYVWLGLPAGLLGVAWPSMRQDFLVPQDALGALFLASNFGYLPCTFLAGRLAARFHLGVLLAASTFLAGSAFAVYALSPSWWVVVGAGVLSGVGGGGIDAALNIYVAANHGERAMQWLHACYGVGAMIGPILMTLAISSLGSWRWGYSIVGAIEWGLAVCFLVTVSRWNGRVGRGAEAKPQTEGHAFGREGSAAAHQESSLSAGRAESAAVSRQVPLLHTLREWSVWLSMLLFFVYMGLEVTLGSWAYTLLTEGRAVSPRAAGFFMSGYWGIFTIGRLAAGLYIRRFALRNIVVGSLGVAGIGLVLLTLNVPGLLNLIACALVGLAISPVLAALLSETPTRVGPTHMANTIGMQLAATAVGAAVLPSLAGVVAGRISLQAVPAYLLGVLVLLLGLYLVPHLYRSRVWQRP